MLLPVHNWKQHLNSVKRFWSATVDSSPEINKCAGTCKYTDLKDHFQKKASVLPVFKVTRWLFWYLGAFRGVSLTCWWLWKLMLHIVPWELFWQTRACGCARLSLSTSLTWSTGYFTLWLINLFVDLECLIWGPRDGGGPKLEAWLGLHWGKGTWLSVCARCGSQLCEFVCCCTKSWVFPPGKQFLPSQFSDPGVPSVNGCLWWVWCSTACVQQLGPAGYNGQGCHLQTIWQIAICGGWRGWSYALFWSFEMHFVLLLVLTYITSLFNFWVSARRYLG